VQRRQLLFASVALACAWASGKAQAHTPFNQWVVYRKKHLLIGCHKEDLATYTLAQQLISVLDFELPTAKARIARAPTTRRLASLLATEQLDVAVLSPDDVVLMATGKGQFAPYGRIELRTLFLFTDYVLAVRNSFPVKHAWLVAHALHESEFGDQLDSARIPPLPWHEGAALYLGGKPLPTK